MCYHCGHGIDDPATLVDNADYSIYGVGTLDATGEDLGTIQDCLNLCE